MAAPKANEFWKLRSKHGRERIFKNGESIEAAASEFMSALYGNPLKEHDFVGKDAVEVEKNKMRVPTWPRFANFCGVHTQYFKDMRADLKEKKDEVSVGISVAIARIDDLFYAEKFEAASAGLANPSLIGKDLGITDKIDVTTDGQQIASHAPVLRVEIVPPREDED